MVTTMAEAALGALIGFLTTGTVVARDQDLVQELESPYRAVRARAFERLTSLRDDELRRQFLLHESVALRRAAAMWFRDRPDPRAESLLVDRLFAETDAGVRALLADALAQLPAKSVLAACRERLTAQDAASQQSIYDRLLRTAVQARFEERMSDGEIPGFYDGQFEALWELDPAMPERLIEYSRDPGFHFVFRALAVMALHETRRDSLEHDLAPLLLDVDEEFWVDRMAFLLPRPPDAETVELRREAELSKYARFSLAKAGKPAALTEMIGRMDAELDRGRALLDSRLQDPDFLDQNESILREWLLGILFETGYYFQQFDDYDRAAERYRQLIERYPEARACQSAHYNLACIESIRNRPTLALHHLRAAVRLGFDDYRWLQEDGDLAPLRELDEFQSIVESARRGGGADAVGQHWMEKVISHLPPGRSLFDLAPAEQERILTLVRRELSEGEVRSLLESAPQAQRERLRLLLR